ncbi:hypothetical protein [Haloarcula argentinensis]|uniref:Uncharacterized protein n=1 Tax=Haloarcula argentinensis TaxID=43776 RepID=A0A847UKL3_HALAR|nr:hypothetical protein [Haloarcula argentinensis]NLV11688.1 hypothetical protein [Haloarcula argentinensis]
MYDVVATGRETGFTLGTADYVSISIPEPDLVSVELPPIQFTTKQSEFKSELRGVLETAFTSKDERSTTEERKHGLANIQSYVDAHNGSTVVADLYQVAQTE